MKNEIRQNNFRQILSKKVNVKIWKLALIVFFILLILLFSGNKGFNWHKDLLKSLEKEKDSLIEISIKRQDSLLKIANNAEQKANSYRYQIEELNYQNTLLYDKLRKKERELRTSVDTSFRNNARRIADSVNRFYSKQNDLR